MLLHRVKISDEPVTECTAMTDQIGEDQAQPFNMQEVLRRRLQLAEGNHWATLLQEYLADRDEARTKRTAWGPKQESPHDEASAKLKRVCEYGIAGSVARAKR